MTVAAIEQAPTARTNGYLQAVILIVVGFFATTLAQPQVLARLPLTNLMKNELHLTRSTVSGFFFLCGLPWYFKPLAGIVTDAFPLLGSRRKSYLTAATALSVAGWVVLVFTPHQYLPLFWVCLVINLFMVVASTALGGYMVEVAQASAGSGRLSSIRNLTQGASSLFSTLGSGYLGTIAFGWTAGICGGVMFLLLPATLLLLYEQRKHIDSRQVLANFGLQFSNIVTARTLWAAAGLTLLVFIAPGFTTALFYKQQNDLHMTTIAQGQMNFVASLVAVAAPVAYILACRRFNLRFMLALSLALGAASTFGYMLYNSVGNAYAITAVNAFTSTLGEVALMDLAVRATPVGSESLGFALMISVRNLALFGTDWLGSLMLDKLHLPFNDLVIANAVTTAIAVPFVFLLPGALVRRRDAEVLEDFPEPRSQMQD
jgi:MFS family permease